MACTIKHLAQAYVMQGEIDFGYPNHALGVLGHLAEASEECIAKYPDLAAELRRERQMFFRSLLKDGEPYDVPYFNLFEKIMGLLADDPDCGNCEETRGDFKARVEEAKAELAKRGKVL